METIKYRPFRAYAWFIPMTLLAVIMCFVVAYHFLSLGNMYGLLAVALGIISFWLTKYLYDYSNILVLFEPEGLRIVGGKHKNYRYIKWCEFAYAHYIRNCRGYPVLVLTSIKLSKKQAKRFANRAKICNDFAVVIYMDLLQNTTAIKNFVDALDLQIVNHNDY